MANPTGSSADILARVKQLIPNRWFAFTAPIRDAVLGGLSDGAAWCYSWIQYAQSQARIATSSGPFLDIIAYDFLGRHLLRNGAGDQAFRLQIQATILQERVTRQGMINALTALTGSVPSIFEPWNTYDTGAYGVPLKLAYGQAGGYGSMRLPGQVFIRVQPGIGIPIPNVGGYGNYPGGYGSASSIEYVSPAQEFEATDDGQIYDVITTTRPTGVIAWTRLSSSPNQQQGLIGTVETLW